MLRFVLGLLMGCVGLSTESASAQWPVQGIFARTNLVAWCIVPFDTQKRGPEERAAMLDRLGLHRLAYDWRAEHIPTFDAEVAALQKHGIELTAWWFPAALNDDAKAILACLERHRLHPQLWVTMGTEPESDSAKLAQKIDGAVITLSPICDAAARLGCMVGLYNHLGWFGEPTNQVVLLQRLRAAGHTNVGSVYNFHHGHGHIDDFADQLRRLQPYLLAVNLNGMVWNGDQRGQKIIPVGTGDEELEMLRVLNASGWSGPVGIIGHTEEDVEGKLRKELDGLEKLVPQVAQPPGPKKVRPVRTQQASANGSNTANPPGGRPTLAAAVQGQGPSATSRNAGEPPMSGREPGVQGEKDWVDNRWQETDAGPFLASNLRWPDGSAIAKGLSVRVGQQGEGAVAYDTATATFRGAWTGGFLKFDPSRFGLIGPPKPAGELVVVAPAAPAWRGATVRFRGLWTHGPRTVIEYDVSGTRVREMPWADATPAGVVFLRDFTLGPRTNALRWVVAAESPTGIEQNVAIEETEQVSASGVRVGQKTLRQTWTQAGRVHLTTVIGTLGVEVKLDRGLEVEVPPNDRETLLGVAMWTGESKDLAAYLAWEKANFELYDVSSYARPGPRKWEELTTVGQRGADNDFLAVDTLTMPYDNPWKALLFASGVDFTPDGAAYVCTIHGDVWRVTGLDDSMHALKWRRFATGLFQPLGLKVRDGQVFVLGRDRITRLLDQNRDGEADFYESFFDGIATSTGGHDYVTSLEQDRAGNFYYADPVGAHRIVADGSREELIATGFRNPNGLGVSPDGRVITVAPQQGTWTPSSGIWELRPGLYGGFGGPKVTDARPLGYDAPLCWIPHPVDNSSGSQVWVPAGQWGPLGGQMLHLLWGRCGMMLGLRDAGGSEAAAQGAVVPLPTKFLSGPNRGSFNPRDGQLYVAGSTGWQTSAVKDGCLQRVRFTGKPMNLPVGFHVRPDGLELMFSEGLDRGTAEDSGSYSLKQWNYRYASEYGSKDWSVAHPNQEGRDDVAIRSAKLGADGRTVFLAIPDLQPVMQMELKYNVDGVNGAKPARGQLWLTVNQVK